MGGGGGAAAATFTASAFTAPRLRNSIYLFYSDYLPPKERSDDHKYRTPGHILTL